jgi:hypothetical protein
MRKYQAHGLIIWQNIEKNTDLSYKYTNGSILVLPIVVRVV